MQKNRHRNVDSLYSSPFSQPSQRQHSRLSIRTETDFLNGASWAKRERDSSWHQGIFSDLVNARFKLDIVRTEVASNMAALGLARSTINVAQNAHTDERASTGWESVLRLTSTVEQMVEIFTQSYSQGASIQEAKTPNDLTCSVCGGVNKNTTLAMFFLPTSVISGIFFMGEVFCPASKNKFRGIFSRHEAYELPL